MPTNPNQGALTTSTAMIAISPAQNTAGRNEPAHHIHTAASAHSVRSTAGGSPSDHRTATVMTAKAASIA